MSFYIFISISCAKILCVKMEKKFHCFTNWFFNILSHSLFYQERVKVSVSQEAGRGKCY